MTGAQQHVDIIKLNQQPEIPWGPTGEVVYDRTYSRTKPDGTKETWPETVERVCRGNLELVYGTWGEWPKSVWEEFDRLRHHMLRFAIIPAGRHLWASGVKGRQYLFNCHVSGWGEKLSDHFEFTFLRLMEGGGVGANYSSRFLQPFGAPRRQLKVHIVCDPMHQDYEEMLEAGVLSTEYDSDWAGAFNVEDSREGWAAALVDLLDTYMTDGEVQHANRVYDVSRVRCKGSRLKTFGGTASGPGPFAVMMHEVARVLNGAFAECIPPVVHWDAAKPAPWGPGEIEHREDGRVYYAGTSQRVPFFERRTHLTPTEAMEIDHAIAECVVSGGNRRSARMAICRWDDPHIFDFLACKQDTGKHWTTNISVEVTDEFFKQLAEQGPDGNHAGWVHDAVVKGMLLNGEPGYWNSSLSNVGEVNEVVATNPCGEIALEAWENCNLGHVNLDQFAPTRKGGPVDWLGLDEAHRLITRFLIRATYGDVNDPKQAAKLAANRRIGVGHLGVQAFFAKRGYAYGKVPLIGVLRRELRDMAKEVRKAAREAAFALRIPEPVKVTCVAPTGTIAKLPGVSEGIHPIYARYFIRRVRFSLASAEQAEKVQEFQAQGFHTELCQYDQSNLTAVVEFPTKDNLLDEVEALGYNAYEAADLVQSADEIPLDAMLAFQQMYQEEYADNAVSFTANVPEGLDVSKVAETIASWLPMLKGTTIMVDGSRPQAPMERITASDYQQASARLVADGTDEDCASGACPVR
ncbi:ribonucleoside-triphosphate reductase, adenosylcobalamin-dependent [Micromonospora sp. NPDC049240]|uniref:ribonucleoside-triphosphate reductase, adenosylcobalamin-dependent n=1 Tax=Micromonospora sp. NPDC049240 TaxID=3155151 RepID=UPI0033D50E50